MRRNIKKQVWLNKTEAEALKKKAKKTCLTEAALMRMLITNFEPREKPDDKFYDEMKKISGFADEISKLAYRQDDEITRLKLMKEVKRWYCFQKNIEEEYLRPKEAKV